MNDMNFDTPLFERIESELEKVSFPNKPSNLYDPLRYMLSMNGKRVRPVLALLAADLFGKEELDEVTPISLAIEYFHNFTLIHDDIMDNATLRRGKAPVYKKWNNNIAILSGDVLMIKAYESLSQCPDRYISQLLSTFNKIAIEVCEGQQLDIDYEERNEITEDEYLFMIRQKTSVLLGGALRLGAILADADDENLALIDDFGINLGMAFQLQDDILDTYGEQARVGKRIGGDILENKKTILLVKLMKVISADDKEVLNYLLHKEENEQKKIYKIIELYNKYSIREKAIILKDKYTSLALSKLKEVNVKSSKKIKLQGLVNDLLNRSS